MGHLSSTILMCAILLLFYASGTVKGDLMGKLDQCSDANSECSSDGAGRHKCLCTSAYFDSSGICTSRAVPVGNTCNKPGVASECTNTNAECRTVGGELRCFCKLPFYTSGTDCITRIAPEATCTSGGASNQCVDNAECTAALKCVCTTNYYKSGTACKAQVNIGSNCDKDDTATDQCSVTNTACNTGTSKCSCTSAYYESSSTCHDRIAPEATCTSGGASNQCVDNAECTAALKCVCTTNYYKSGTACKAQVNIGSNCDKDDTATDQCSVTNTACNTGTSKCSCTSAYYESSSTCHDRIAPEATCTSGGASNQCVDNAECTAALKCVCTTNYYKSGTACKAQVNIGSNCDKDHTATDQCYVTNTACNTGTSKCSCTSAYYESSSTCHDRIAPEATCTSGGASNQCVDNAECTAALKCVCTTNYYKSGTACKAQVNIGSNCDKDDTATDQCSVTNTACNTGTSKCSCTSAYYESSSTCHDRKKPAEDCLVNQCVANAMCSSTNNKCACNTDYIATPTTNPTSCESSDAATIMLAHMHVFIFGTVASLYFLV